VIVVAAVPVVRRGVVDEQRGGGGEQSRPARTVAGNCTAVRACVGAVVPWQLPRGCHR
jgi:hypothetical protein